MGSIKNTIVWHMDCLRNRKLSLIRYLAQLKNIQAQVDCSQQSIYKLEQQIAEAERRGLTEFDANRFLPQLKG